MTDDITLPDFGEPMPKDELLEFAELSLLEADSGVDWWDENASLLFIGVLE